MDPELWEMLEEGDSEDEVAAIIRLGQPGIVPPGVRLIVQFGEIATVRMKRRSILDIREEAEVASFKAPGPSMGPDVELDDTELLEGLPETFQPGDERRPPSLDATGRNVVVGIVDWGLDFAHPDFRNPDGSTRILALWDQRGRPGSESPQPYGYGLVHTCEEINRALATSDPYAALGYHPADADMGRGSHGTLVASIAAGNGDGGGPSGIAPEAEIVFVHFATWGQDSSARLGNSVTLLEAIDFITRTAGERPCAINLSMGRTGEQHDGTTLSEQGLDAVVRASPGRVICQSTGNYFTRRLHASGQLRPAEERRLVWEVHQADVTPNELEIWYPGRDKMEIEIRSPDDVALARLKLGERVPLTVNGQTLGRVYHREAEPNNLANHIDIFLYAAAPAGAWSVTLIATDVVDGRFHAWIERDAACPNCQSHFRSEDADPTSTTGTICNGLRTIAVGAYNPHHPDQAVASFSSVGPTRDGRFKPDLCAAGDGILGARSAPRDVNGETPLLTRMSGTSFAAPHVTGCVALMLQVAPRPLRIEEVHNLLLASTRKVSFPEELPGRVGSGYLDIEKAVEAARNIERIGPVLKPPSVAKEAAMMREDQEIEMVEIVEGKAEDEAVAFVPSETLQAAEAPETDAAEIVELADQAIAEQAVARTPVAILHHVLSRAGMAEALTLPDRGRLPCAAELFDAFVYPGREALRSQLEQYFEVVALPRTPLDSKLRRGDLLVRRGEGGLGHLSLIASPELRSYEEVLSEGLIPEAFNQGKYAHVVDAGARPHMLSDAYARRVTDDTERLPYDQLVLRTRDHVRQRLAESAQLDESVILPSLVESFSGQVYTTGWTTFMPIELNGKPHYLAYKILTGDASIDRIRPGARQDTVTHWPVDVVHAEKWSLGWTTLMPFKLPGSSRPHYLAYKALTGEVGIDRIKPDGKGVDTIWGTSLDPADRWTAGWTDFMPFTIDGKPHYLAYKMLTGTVAIGRIKPDGKGVDTIWGTSLDASIQWAAGWTTFMPFKLPGSARPHYLAYKALTGEVSIGRVKADGKGIDRIWGTPLDSTIKWTSGWTHFMPFTLDGKPHYLAYKAATGEVAIDRIKPDGKGADTIWGTPLDASLKWIPDWTTIMPFKMDGKPHYFAYNASNGWVSVGSIAEELRRCVSPGVSRDDPTALNLSPIGTDDFNVTLTVRGTSYEVKGNVFYPGQSNGARVPFNTSAVPGGKAPIVFIAHGNHALFYNPANRLDERGTNPGGFRTLPNHKGYEYFQQLLAQMGMISVSVDCNQFSGFIGLSPTNIQNRADLVLGAIKHFQSLNSGSDPTFGGHVDFSRVGLMGHSRGGEVVLLVPELLALSSTGISGVTVKGVISIAPTDAGATSGKPGGFAFMTVLPAADLDVIENDGARFYDQASSDPFKCQIYIYDANHNFFNTEWVSDDHRTWNPVTSSLTTPRSHINVMNKDDEKAILKAYGCAFFRTVLLGHNLRKFLEGLEVPPGVARFRDVHIAFERTSSTTVDDNEDHDIARNTLGKSNSRAGGLSADEYDFGQGAASVFNSTFYGNTRGMVAQSSSASGQFRWELGAKMDLTGREIRIRTAEVYNGTSVPADATGFRLGLVDGAAKRAFVDSDSVGGLPRPYDRRADDLALFSGDFTKTMLTTLRFPISCFARVEAGFDPRQVSAIVLRMDRNDGRALAFDQLQIV